MSIEVQVPGVDELDEMVAAMGEWQLDEAAMQLHPGDVGWLWRFGAETTAAASRVWRRDGEILAAGMLDGADLLRMTTSPSARHDEELAQQLLADLSTPGRGVLPAGTAYVEAPQDALLQDVLADAGWGLDEPWQPLRRDLAEPVEDPGVRIEVVGDALVPARVAVQRASFERSTFTDGAWRTMAAGPAYADARCLLALDEQEQPVAAITVWSAGPGRTGLIEPMGVHRDHRGHGYGRAICVAAAAALRDLGSSSAIVCTRSANVAGVATYAAAGYVPLPEVRDRRRDA